MLLTLLFLSAVVHCDDHASGGLMDDQVAVSGSRANTVEEWEAIHARIPMEERVATCMGILSSGQCNANPLCYATWEHGGNYRCFALNSCKCDYETSTNQERCRLAGNNNGCGNKHANGQLGNGMGDCDQDFHCAGDLVCGHNNCPWGDGDDCCMPLGPCSDGNILATCTCGGETRYKGAGSCSNNVFFPPAGRDCSLNNWVLGDGTGGTEHYISRTNSFEDCKDIVSSYYSNANGVTWGYTGSNYKKCYAEIGMTGVSTSSASTSRYRTCQHGPGCTCDAVGAARSEACRVAGNDDGCGGNLGDGMGDCDNDSDCAGSLVCGSNNCSWGDNDDCCKSPASAAETARSLAYVPSNSAREAGVVVHALAALGVAVVAYGAFRYYTQKCTDYIEVEV